MVSHRSAYNSIRFSPYDDNITYTPHKPNTNSMEISYNPDIDIRGEVHNACMYEEYACTW